MAGRAGAVASKPAAAGGTSASFCGTNTFEVKVNQTSTFNHTLSAGSNRLVIVQFSWQTVGRTLDSCTYGGVAMTLVPSSLYSSGSTGVKVQAYYLAEASLPSNGAQTIDPTFSSTETLMRIGCSVKCLQDVPSPTLSCVGDAGTSTTFYPSTITSTSVPANSVILLHGAHQDTPTATLSCDIGTNTTATDPGEIVSLEGYVLDSGASGNKSSVWSVSAESANTKAAHHQIIVDY